MDVLPMMTGSGGGGGNASAQRALLPGEETCNYLAKKLGFMREDEVTSSSPFPSPPGNVPYVKGPFKSMAFDGNFDDMDKVKIVIKKPGKMGQKFLSISRGKRATPYRVFITEHMDMKNINEEVDMSFPEALAQWGNADACRHWVNYHLTKKARQFFKMVFAELWTWEFGEQYHLDMLNILDEG